MNEGSIEVPPGFVDRSVHILEWADGDKKQTMLVQREPLPEGSTLVDFIDASLAEYARGMQHFALNTRRMIIGTRYQTELVSFRWLAEGGLVAQAQTFAIVDGAVLIQTITTAPAERPRGEELVERAARSLKPRRAPVKHSDLPFGPASSASAPSPSSSTPPPPAEMGTGTL